MSSGKNKTKLSLHEKGTAATPLGTKSAPKGKIWIKFLIIPVKTATTCDFYHSFMQFRCLSPVRFMQWLIIIIMCDAVVVSTYYSVCCCFLVFMYLKVSFNVCSFHG